MSLTIKQQAFVMAMCDPYCKGQTEAARRAGYTGGRAAITATELMRKPEIIREIERQRAAKFGAQIEAIERKAKTGEVSRESLCHECDEVIEECKTGGAGSWQMQNRLKAIELKAKLNGLLTDKVEVGLSDKIMQILESARRRSGITSLPPAPEPIEGEMSARAN